MGQSAIHQGECRQAQVGLGLATPSGEEEQFNGLPVDLSLIAEGLGQARQIHQHEGQLEETPTRGAGSLSDADLVWGDLGGEG